MFIVIMFGGYFAQQRRIGDADFMAWLSTAAFLTMGMAFLFSALDLINITVLLTSIAVSVGTIVLLIFSKRT